MKGGTEMPQCISKQLGASQVSTGVTQTIASRHMEVPGLHQDVHRAAVGVPLRAPPDLERWLQGAASEVTSATDIILYRSTAAIMMYRDFVAGVVTLCILPSDSSIRPADARASTP